MSPSAGKTRKEALPRKKVAGRTPTEAQFELRLYVAGQTRKSLTAFANLKKICEEHLAGQYALDVIDIYRKPTLAKGEQIIAAPTLIKKLPLPMRKLIGDMSDKGKVLVGLDIRIR